MISGEDFQKLDIGVGRIRRDAPLPEARKSARLWVDFRAEIGETRSSAQITRHDTPDALVGRQVLAVVYVPPCRIGPVGSEVQVPGLPDAEGEGVRIAPEREMPLGGRLF